MEKIILRFLVADVTLRCNLRCSMCSHYMPYLSNKDDYPIDLFKRDLNLLKDVIHVKSFHIEGGEPLLLGDKLFDYIDAVRASDISDYITIYTNGILLKNFNENIFDSVDGIVVSQYPGVEIEEVSKENVRYIKRGKFVVYHENPGDAELSWNTCTLKHSCNTMHRGKFSMCTVSVNKGEFLNTQGIPNDLPDPDDSVDLSAPDLNNAMRNYLNRENPLSACKWCYTAARRIIVEQI